MKDRIGKLVESFYDAMSKYNKESTIWTSATLIHHMNPDKKVILILNPVQLFQVLKAQKRYMVFKREFTTTTEWMFKYGKSKLTYKKLRKPASPLTHLKNEKQEWR